MKNWLSDLVDCKVLWILGFKNSVKICCFVSRVTADVDSYIVSFYSIYILVVFFPGSTNNRLWNWMHERALCKDVNHKSNALSKLNNSCDEVTNIHASTTPLSLFLICFMLQKGGGACREALEGGMCFLLQHYCLPLRRSPSPRLHMNDL